MTRVIFYAQVLKMTKKKLKLISVKMQCGAYPPASISNQPFYAIQTQNSFETSENHGFPIQHRD